jgi:hypothetical protein
MKRRPIPGGVFAFVVMNSDRLVQSMIRKSVPRFSLATKMMLHPKVVAL